MFAAGLRQAAPLRVRGLQRLLRDLPSQSCGGGIPHNRLQAVGAGLLNNHIQKQARYWCESGGPSLKKSHLLFRCDQMKAGVLDDGLPLVVSLGVDSSGFCWFGTGLQVLHDPRR